MNQELTQTGPNWRQIIRELKATLDELRPRLIEAEANLSERLAAINAFEYAVRARFEALTRRLDDIQFEIDTLRRELRRYQNDFFDVDGAAATGQAAKDPWRIEEQAAAAGAFRYRATPSAPPKVLAAEQATNLKQLYRQLARRFHPDLALDEVDREYRTGIMMAINAAYAAGDVGKLEQLALEPEHVSGMVQTDEELAETLQREIDRCQRRLQEIDQELATLERHESARLMKRVERAAAHGRDLLDELAADLRDRIAEKMVERDALEGQLEDVEREGIDMSADDLADIVYNLGLEQAGDDSLFPSEPNWQPRNRSRWSQKGIEDEANPEDDD